MPQLIVQPSALFFGGQPGYMTYATADYFIIGYISCLPEIHYCVYSQVCLVIIITTIYFITYVINFYCIYKNITFYEALTIGTIRRRSFETANILSDLLNTSFLARISSKYLFSYYSCIMGSSIFLSKTIIELWCLVVR